MSGDGTGRGRGSGGGRSGHGRGRGSGAGQPSFSGGRGRGQKTSLGPRDGSGRGQGQGGRGGRSGRGGRGGGRKHNGNYFGPKDGEGGASGGTKYQPHEDFGLMEEGLGFERFLEGDDRLGWLFNYNATSVEDKEASHVVSAINCYFMCEDGSMFQAQVKYSPYFYLQIKDGLEMEVDALLRRKYEGVIRDIEIVEREDLDLKNHLSGLKRRLLKMTFWNEQQLQEVKRDTQPLVRRNRSKFKSTAAYAVEVLGERSTKDRVKDALEAVEDMREFDVPFHMRWAIDSDVRCGHWFVVKALGGKVTLTRREEMKHRAEPRICAFDIETTKLPLQFPNAEYDQVFMISYMVDKVGYLIVNREVVGADIGPFEYTPKPEYEGPFTIFNEPDEQATLRRWFDHMREVKPSIYVTYNGDYFDWPFIETRAAVHNMDMFQEIGFKMDKPGGNCLSKFAVHMDCLAWVNRDSYLPQGSRGLKMVTKAKLGFDPIEVDPEDMLRFAAEQPQTMASYSVSDAVSTYYLYMTYIHPFIFSLATVIPLPPDEVLRKGSGTLCEALLMVQAFQANVLCPNKHNAKYEAMFKGHLLDSETYIGGKVEALESGVFRSDLPTRFKLQPDAYQGLLDKVDDDLKYAIEVEGGMQVADITNYAEVREEIVAALKGLRDVPAREETPLIYHLDVAAMYPNIILTNRLQPSAIVTDEDCAACEFNKPGKTCLRPMTWVWRGETFAATASEYYSIKSQLQAETFPAAEEGGAPRLYMDMTFEERDKLLKTRLKKYCQKVYKRVVDKPVEEVREAGVCQRENDFYVGTVLDFRDRRYEYKRLNKQWKGKHDDAKAAGDALATKDAADMVVVYDSLQLAHKCILNSFYGYVMRKGARWYSMEMAGVVTKTGADIIQKANELVQRIGVPLELDTDGIWCCLPSSFPENFKLKNVNGKDLKISYPCVVLNVMVAQHNTNPQYATLVDPNTKKYETTSKMSIEFEVDGPYRAMVLPASKEEGKLIKKRYAVFNDDGSLAELKGFELKRRGELKLIKAFQGEVFAEFLKGQTLTDCYAAVGAVADRWLDLLDTQGTDLSAEELLTYISESSTMSKSIEEYEGRKSCAITTARRLGHFLGDERIKDKGLNCNYVVARRPEGTPTSERAVPVAIFATEPAIARAFLRKWCGDVCEGGPGDMPDVRAIVDWGYYRERLSGAIQKIITIPAALQRITNPVPRVAHPDWLHKRIREKNDKFQQRKLDSMFAAKTPQDTSGDIDMEDFGISPASRAAGQVVRARAVSRHASPGAGASSPSQSPGQENMGAIRNEQVQPEGGAEPMEAAAPPGPAPEWHENTKAWLAYQKQKWAAANAERKRKRALSDKAVAKSKRRGIPLQGNAAFFGDTAAEAAQHWQLLQIAPTHTPGLFKAWVLRGDKLWGVPVRVDRTMYVDTSLQPPEAQAVLPDVAHLARIKRTTPDGNTPPLLYQVTMEEAEFRRRAPELESALGVPSIQRVLEGRLPLAWEAALMLGCCAAPAPHAASRDLGDTFSLKDLVFKATAGAAYLEGGGPEGLGALRHMGLCHAGDALSGRAVFALHLPANGQLHVVVVNPARRATQEISPAAAERSWQEAFAPSRFPGGEAPEAPEVEAHVSYVKTEAAAAVEVARAVSAMRTMHRGPMMLIVQAQGGCVRMTHAIPSLAAFPAMELPVHGEQPAFPMLGWQAPAARDVIIALAGFGGELQARAALARYAHLPVAALGDDWMCSVSDALLARNLRDANLLLWAVDPAVPDLRGSDQKDDPSALFTDDQPRVEVLRPGAYRCVCVELEVQHLAVAAITALEELTVLEGGESGGAAAGPPALPVLAKLVAAWLKDASERNSRAANQLLMNVYRWLASETSLLAAPALLAAVQGAMRKLMLQLVAEAAKLGATIVAANFESIIISTGKYDLPSAVGYTDYLLEALQRRELFGWLQLKPRAAWHGLLFRDRYNWQGLSAPLGDALVQQLTMTPGALTQGGDAAAEALSQLQEAPAGQMEFCWNIKDFLPPARRPVFLATVAEFLLNPWRSVVHSAEVDPCASSQGVALTRSQAQQMEEAVRRHITDTAGPQVMKHTLAALKQGGRAAEQAFPTRPGSHLPPEQLGSPALAMVKTICEVLQLDPCCEEEVAQLRRNCLRIVDCRAFSPAAAFLEPCQTWVLRGMVCTECNACHDLDLARDEQIQDRQWACRSCGAARDPAAVEAVLVKALHHQSRAYQLQDLRCVKCKQVSMGHLRRSCHNCGGKLHNTLPADEFAARVGVFAGVAYHQGFDLLAADCAFLQPPS